MPARSKRSYNNPFLGNNDITDTGTPPLEYDPKGFMDQGGVYVQVSMYQSGKIELAIQATNVLQKFTLEPSGAIQLGDLLTKMGQRAATVRKNVKPLL